MTPGETPRGAGGTRIPDALLLLVLVLLLAWTSPLPPADLSRMRMSMLHHLAEQSRLFQGLLLGDTLALTVGALDRLKASMVAPVTLWPEHRLQFGFSPEVSRREAGRCCTSAPV